MGYIRRRVKNYTILILSIDEKSETIDRAAALRVRNGQEAGTFHLEREEGDPEKQQEDFDDFRDFLSNDLVMLTDYSAVRPVMDKWYQAGAGEFFTNTAMDMLPQIEEAVPMTENPEAFRKEVEEAGREKDLLTRARRVHKLYETAAGLLFSYQQGYPYWISMLPKEEERYMAHHLPAKKQFRKAMTAWVFGLHYFYLGNPKRNILYLLTLGGCFLWMFFDLYRMPLLVDEANERMAEKVYLGAPKFPVSGPSR